MIKKIWEKYNLTIWFFYGVIIAISVFFPFLDVIVLKRLSLDIQIDPEIMNGLITTSSILFGFSSLLVVSQKPIRITLFYLLLIPLILLGLSGSMLSAFAYTQKEAVIPLLFLESCFLSNVVTTFFIVGYITHMIHDEETKHSNNV